MRRINFRRGLALAGLGCIVVGSACAPDLNTSRTIPARGTVGVEVFGVLCDRVGAQALPEDLTGASFQAVCHQAPDGSWSNTVDTTQLPPLDPNAVDVNGNPVPLATQEADRAHAVARIQALATDRAKLVGAVDAAVPNIPIPIKDVNNPDPTQSCNAPVASGQGPLPTALADMLGRLTSLYDDGTIPESTESLGRLMSAFENADDARAAYARFDARQGYRPISVALGAMRPMMAYPQLRDFANATLNLLSSDSQPYGPNPQPIPGAVYAQLTEILAAAYQELRTVQPDNPPVAPLGAVTEDSVGREILSRPRTDLEFLQQLFYAQSTSFGGGTSAYIVQRDTRGYAQVALVNGLVPPPFLDADADGMADVDALGQFLTTNGQPAPTPFFSVGVPDDAPSRDAFGRALAAQGGAPIYDSIDTSHTYAASLMNAMQPLVNADPTQNHETLMNALAGGFVLFGSRDGQPITVKQYPPDPAAQQNWSLTNSGPPPENLATTPVNLTYNAFHAADAPMLDLLYAIAQVVGDPSIDDTLQLTKTLMTQDASGVARVVGAALQMRQFASQHPEAHIPATSTFWDEMIDVVVQIEQDPPAQDGSRLLEDLIASLGDPNSANLGQILSNYYNFNDQISYDRNNLNGPAFNLTTNDNSPMQTPVNRAMPDIGYNRSAFQRFIQLIHDTNGLTVCNKDGATVDAQLAGLSVTLPLLGGTYGECQVFQITNAAEFYVDAILGKGQMWIRDDFVRNGVAGLGAADVELMEDSSGITGFWGEIQSDTSLFPTPQYLDRQMFFDLANDSPTGGTNYTTNNFLSNLQGLNGVGTSVCPERVIADPCVSGGGNGCTGESFVTNALGISVPNYGSVGSDGMIHGLRSCPQGDSLVERDDNTIFTWEDFNFFQALTPFISAFAKHNREDLFVQLLEVMHRHWADANGSADECLLSTDPNAQYKECTKDGLVTYEPLLVQVFATDFIPALGALEQTVAGMSVNHCDQIDPTAHECTQSHAINGVNVLATAARALLDPTQAGMTGLTDRHGTVTGLRNDGTTNPQVTPIYLITEALNNIDQAFATYAMANPNDSGRQALWLSARSQLVDQFFGVTGSLQTSAFADPSIPAVAPVIIDTLRAQIFANCPLTFTPPGQVCQWARTTLTQNAANVVGGPLFAGMMDVSDAMRANPSARIQLEKVMGYMFNAASQNDALPALLASADDMIQLLRDDTNLVPFFHVLATAASPSITDSNGNIVQKGLADAQMSLLSRISGKAFAADGVTELCSKEVDPNQVMSLLMANLVTPMPTQSGQTGPLGETPLEAMIDVIADVNRAGPGQSAKLTGADYASIADNMVDFLMDKTRGLEQFYAIIKLGTE